MAGHSLKTLPLFNFELRPTFVLFAAHAFAVDAILFVDFGTAGIILSDTLCSGLIVEAQTLLPLVFIFGETALSLELFGLASESLLFKLGGTLLLLSLGSHGSSLGVLLFKADALGLLLLLPDAVLSFKLLAAQSELLSIALGLQSFSLLELALIQLSEFSLHFLFIVISLTL